MKILKEIIADMEQKYVAPVENEGELRAVQEKFNDIANGRD